MIKPSLFRNYILLSIFVTLGIFVAGASLTHFLTRLRREKMEPPPNMLLFTARIMEEIAPRDPLKAFALVKNAAGTDITRILWLTDEKGNILDASDRAPLPVNWNRATLPAKEWERERFPGDPNQADWRPSPLAMLGGPPPPPPAEVIRLPADRPLFLVSEFKPRVNPAVNDFSILQLSLLASIVVASLITFGLISLHLRSKAMMAEQVMSELQRGNLKARFPVTKKDEIGRIMNLFNHMGDEIERLVEKVRHNEQSRMFIMQELAHDLRTPIASLRSMLETLREGEGKIPKAISDELFEMSMEEVSYFNRLVEDLLLLAQVLEPQYHSPHVDLRWAELLEDEVDKLNRQEGVRGSDKRVELSASDVSPTLVRGDDHLLRRVFRNVLVNALTYARKRVSISSSVQDGRLKIIVRDDGPGFSAEVLGSYGERRFSRFINSSQGGAHLSVGLGAVIVKKVISIHQGDVAIRNYENARGEIAGAEVTLSFPLA